MINFDHLMVLVGILALLSVGSKAISNTSKLAMRPIPSDVLDRALKTIRAMVVSGGIAVFAGAFIASGLSLPAALMAL